VFPSGHALRATAVALTTGYVLAREGLARPGRAAALAAAAPSIVGLGRLVEEKHLASDVLGGWLAGAALAAATAGAYELARSPRRGPARRRRTA
jgi:undecaprenyl-diphosphatase